MQSRCGMRFVFHLVTTPGADSQDFCESENQSHGDSGVIVYGNVINERTPL
jgi:hypothetical protein